MGVIVVDWSAKKRRNHRSATLTAPGWMSVKGKQEREVEACHLLDSTMEILWVEVTHGAGVRPVLANLAKGPSEHPDQDCSRHVTTPV